MKNKVKGNKLEGKKYPKVAQKQTKMEPSAPQQMYQVKELERGLSKFVEILAKVKTEIKIDYFLELADCLNIYVRKL